jgi:hypothetical protein
MKRCGLIVLALALVSWSGDSPFEHQTARANDGTAPQQGALAENAAHVDKAASSDVVKVHRTVYAEVVAIDQPFVINRMGASQPVGMIFVLKEDLVRKAGRGDATYDNFKLREGKRPRPLVLRMNVGDVLEIHFENWLQSVAVQGTPPTPTQQLATVKPFQQVTRYAGIHVNGLDLVPQKVGGPDGIKSDGSWVGTNDSGLLPPRSTTNRTPNLQSIKYRLYARETGTFLLTSGADTTVHQLDAGLFGAVNVQPRNAEWYRSQTTRCEMEAATLSQDDLRSHEQVLVDAVPRPKLDEGQIMPDADEEGDQEANQRSKLLSLRTVSGDARAQIVADVYFDPDTGLISSKNRQPLINYHAVFTDDDRTNCPTAIPDKPILSMLKAEIPVPEPPKFTGNLNPNNGYLKEMQSLDAGLIPAALTNLFKNEPLKIELAPDATVARVASGNKYSWVVTNPGRLPAEGETIVVGKTYLVQGHEADRTVTIQECRLRLVYSDLTAIITGPNAGNFPFHQESPDFYTNPASPDRRQPYREFTIIYHQAGNAVQAFSQWSNNNLTNMINAGMDGFGINYGIAAIGPEIVANRLGVGPMGNRQQPLGNIGSMTAPSANQRNDAVDLKYEEFFLSAWSVGDPAMVVDVPANAPNQMVKNTDDDPRIVKELIKPNPIAFEDFSDPGRARPTKAFYPDDPSNVYHSYMRDHTKMRILHAGPGPAHVHHLHAHQWLKSPNSPEATYLDSQLILPGSAYTLEITYHGSGNRNMTVGDSIFHCHFYPHFAKGMWSLWRVHDTFEAGTELDRNGVCVTCKPNRALPDGEIAAGTPIPAVVPLPTLGMAPMPAEVQVTDLSPWYKKGEGMGRRVHVIPKNWKKILKQFDRDNDGELNDDERKAWVDAIDGAVAANKKDNKKYGDDGYRWIPYALYDNPGYPFFIPGVSGHRPPHPPLDMAWKEEEQSSSTASVDEKDRSPVSLRRMPKNQAKWTNKKIEEELKLKPSEAVVKEKDIQYLDGGLPRHLVLGGDLVAQYTTRWDFSKDFVKTVRKTDSSGNETEEHVGGLYAFRLPEEGTPVERAAMRAHGTRAHKTALPENGDAGNFIMNGLGPINGAPYADPSVTDDGNSSGIDRRYQAAVIQTDVVLNKKGWHYPQSRFMTLWEDVADTVSNKRAPEPFFIRTATDDATELWHTNLVPNYYELDDFQVRTPTDVIGQHIHLVKFDVTASDGGANGFNYEDGTFGPTEVRDRIHAIMNAGGLYGFDPRTGFVDKKSQKKVAVWPNRYAYPMRGKVGDPEHGLFGPPPSKNQNWDGAMTTIQRWAIDPLLNWHGHDRTLRTVFTHDHFGPSTHQQVGLYAGVLVEPQGSQWYLSDGTPMYTRTDGGPTSWQAMIVTANRANAHREYAIEFQDMQLAYTAESTVGPSGSNSLFKPKLTDAARQKLKDQLKLNYDGANDQAPAAFYIGQSSNDERILVQGFIQLLQGTKDGDPVPNAFLSVFRSYGVPLDEDTKTTTVYNLAQGDGFQGFRGAQWLFARSTTDGAGRPVINGGDYYILEATNPNPKGTSAALSVYMPKVPPGFTDPAHAVNPNPGDLTILAVTTGIPGTVYSGNFGTPKGEAQGTSPNVISNSNFGNGAPFPSLVSTRANGTYSMNYRNEPVQLRVAPQNNSTDMQKDLAFAFSSIKRADDPSLNVQPTPGTPISAGSPFVFPPYLITPDSSLDGPGLPQGTDPFTPLIRGYVGDDIQIRALVGAHLQPHALSIHGVDWLSQPSYHDSGYRNVQSMGISEHYEMRFKMPYAVDARKGTKIPDGADYFYSASTGAVGLSNGLWGIIRSYNKVVGTELKSEAAADPSRASNPVSEYLKPLPNNPLSALPTPISFEGEFNKAKSKREHFKEFEVHATSLAQVKKELVYNSRIKPELKDPNAVIFVQKDDLPKLQEKDARFEPLILRAAAGDWIKLTLINDFPTDATNTPFNKDFSFRYGNPFNDLPMLVDNPCDVSVVSWGDGTSVPTSGQNLVIVGTDNNNQLQIRIFDGGGNLVTDTSKTPLPSSQAGAIAKLKQELTPLLPPRVLSSAEKAQIIAAVTSILGQTATKPNIGQVCMKISQQVGLHPQLVAFDVTKANGINVGFNPGSTVGPGSRPTNVINYYWYAGEIVQTDGKMNATPVEFGAINLTGADLMLQTQFGMVGALIVEPLGSTCIEDPGSHAFCTVTKDGKTLFRECVLVMQNMVSNLSPGRETAASQIGGRDAGFGAVNYRTENFASRNIATVGTPQTLPDQGFAKAFSSFLLKRPADPDPAHPLPVDPETPVFVAAPGMPTRFRVVMPSTTSANGAAQPLVFAIHGHGWQDEPYVDRSKSIGHNDMAQFIGSQEVTVTQKYDIVIDSAGGPFQVPGDYLYQAYNQEQKIGIWGLFRVKK